MNQALKYDDRAAKLEGWAIFECDDGYLRLLRLDCPNDADESLPREPIFASDQQAREHVMDCANAGSACHAAALELDGTRWWTP